MRQWHPLEFYLPQDIALMDSCRTYEELHQVAFAVFSRIGDEASMICGPITSGGLGSPHENLKVFELATRLVAKHEPNLFTQLPFEHAMARIRQDGRHFKGDLHLLEAFYLPLFRSGRMKRLFFLPHWETSRGTLWEHRQAEQLGIERSYIRPRFGTRASGKSLFIPPHHAKPERFIPAA
jgi:hypothetical protein